MKRSVLLCVLFCCSILALAQDVLGTDMNGDGAEGMDAEMLLADRQHRYLSRKVSGVARSINAFLQYALEDEQDREPELLRHFYGDMGAAYAADGSHILIGPRVSWNQKEGESFGVLFSARLRLQGLSDRFRLLFEGDDSDQSLGQDLFWSQGPVTPEASGEGVSAGLLYILSDRVSRRVSISGGARYRSGIVPRVRLDARFFTDLGAWRTELAQRIFWDGKDGFGERTKLQFRRGIGDATQFLVDTSGVWSEVSQGVDWGHYYYLERDFRRSRFVTLRWGLQGHTEPNLQTERYACSLAHRRPLLREWMHWHFEAGVELPREYDFAVVPVFKLQCNILLGSL